MRAAPEMVTNVQRDVRVLPRWIVALAVASVVDRFYFIDVAALAPTLPW